MVSPMSREVAWIVLLTVFMLNWPPVLQSERSPFGVPTRAPPVEARQRPEAARREPKVTPTSSGATHFDTPVASATQPATAIAKSSHSHGPAASVHATQKSTNFASRDTEFARTYKPTDWADFRASKPLYPESDTLLKI